MATLKRVNADTTWMLQLALPGRADKFNLLIDPWLVESQQVDFHPSFSAQTRREAALFPNLPSLARDLANAGLEAAAKDRVQSSRESTKLDTPEHSRIDGILISHPFTDHAHPDTLHGLLGIPGVTNVHCTSAAYKPVARLLSGFGSPSTVEKVAAIHQLECFQGSNSAADLFSVAQSGLPSGLRILRLPAQEPWSHGPAWADLHSAVAILWRDPSSQGSFRCIIYSPHGTLQSSIPKMFSEASVRILMQSFDRQSIPFISYLTGPVALGFDSALTCFKDQSGGGTSFQPHLILSTHDEDKEARGLVAKLIKRSPIKLEDAQKRLDDVCTHQKLSRAVARRLVVGESLVV